jgi:hypothetical protein
MTSRFSGQIYYPEWDDLVVEATSTMLPGIADPSWDTTHYGWIFTPDATKTLTYIMQLPHSWVEGSTITPHVHWSPDNTDNKNIFWRLSYRWTNIGSVIGAFSADDDKVVAVAGTDDLHTKQDFTAIAGTGKTISSLLEFKLSRMGGEGTDTFTGNAIVKSFDVHIQKNTLGSKTISAK